MDKIIVWNKEKGYEVSLELNSDKLNSIDNVNFIVEGGDNEAKFTLPFKKLEAVVRYFKATMEG